MKTVTRIFYRDAYRNVDPEKPPKDTRQLRAFLIANGARDCFLKGEGGWYKLGTDGSLKFFSRALYLYSLEDFLKAAKDDSFIANI